MLWQSLRLPEPAAGQTGVPNPRGGEQGARQVEETFVHLDDVVELTVHGEKITTTEDHPFCSVTAQEFVRADALQPGETVLGADWRELIVGSVRVVRGPPVPAYNLAVHDIHTYHVGNNDILVHNDWLTGGGSGGAKPETEVVQRWMSRAELDATIETGLVRGGREGTHYVTDFANHSAVRARQRLALPQTPEVRVQLEVSTGAFSAPKTVRPDFNMPGGGLENSDRTGPMQGGVCMGVSPGAAVSIVISEPFDLSQSLKCEIVDIDSFLSGADVETVLIRTPWRLEWQGKRYRYLALRGRQAPGMVHELELGLAVECSGVGVGEVDRTRPAAWGYDNWRGGLAVRASAQVL